MKKYVDNYINIAVTLTHEIEHLNKYIAERCKLYDFNDYVLKVYKENIEEKEAWLQLANFLESFDNALIETKTKKDFLKSYKIVLNLIIDSIEKHDLNIIKKCSIFPTWEKTKDFLFNITDENATWYNLTVLLKNYSSVL